MWFHGGGFTTGSGGWDWYDGARLAALGGIVVVTANYRLGPLGWLYLPEIGANNLGSRDQAAVLYWVRDNIASFGGDPALITVGGQSAGAYCALCLAVDPGTRPLVRRVIAESGPWGLAPQEPAEAAEVAAAYLRLRGVRHLPELREMPAERLVSAYGRLSAERARPGEVGPPMYPVLGGAGLPIAPLAAVAAGGLDGTDILLGRTQDEMTAFRAASPVCFPMEGATERVFGAGVTDIASHCPERGRPRTPTASRGARPGTTAPSAPHTAPNSPFSSVTWRRSRRRRCSARWTSPTGPLPGPSAGHSPRSWRPAARTAGRVRGAGHGGRTSRGRARRCAGSGRR